MKKIEEPRILILDLAQPSNAGDEAMQQALVRLVKNNMSNNVFGMSYFGSDDFTRVASEFSHYIDAMGTVVGAGISETYLWATTGRLRRLTARLWNASAILGFYLAYSAGLTHFAKRFFLSKKQRKILALVQDAEIVLWNGRNIRGSGPRASEALKVFELLANPLVAIALKKPLYCIGLSVWPLRSTIARTLLRHVLEQCHGVWVRERESLETLAEIMPNAIHLVDRMRDLAFHTLNEVSRSKSVVNSGRSRDLIAITLVGKKELANDQIHANYLESFSRLVAHVDAKGYRVRIVRQVSYALEPYDEEIQTILARNPQVSIEVTAAAESVEELCAAYAEARLLLASRMHSAIFASAVGTPVLVVSYDSGSKWSILEEVSEPPPLVLKAAFLEENSLVVAFEKAIKLEPSLPGFSLQDYANDCENVFKEVRKRSSAKLQ